MGGLFQLSLLSQSFFLEDFFKEPEIFLLACFVPIKIYHNADSDKSRILAENSGKSGIYVWTHNLSGKIYVGSAVDLSKRLKDYFLLLI